MEFLLSKRVQMAALVSVMGLGILVVIQTLRSLIEVIQISGPTGAAISAPIACAAGLFAWVAKCQLESETEKKG